MHELLGKQGWVSAAEVADSGLGVTADIHWVVSMFVPLKTTFSCI